MHPHTMNAERDPLEQRARAAVIAKTVYRAVLLAWALAAVGMVAIWWLTTPGGYLWPVWPVLGMAVAAVIWGLALYRKWPFAVSRIQLERELDRLRSAER